VLSEVFFETSVGNFYIDVPSEIGNKHI